jgi:hypothetical protein
MDRQDKFHATLYMHGEKVRLTAELITGDPQQLDIFAMMLTSQTVYRGSMTEDMCDVQALLDMLKQDQASLALVEEGLLLKCSPIKILLTPHEGELDMKELRIEMLEEAMADSDEVIRSLLVRLQGLEEQMEGLRQRSPDEAKLNSHSEVLTHTVWPKSRMLLAIITRMFKEGMLDQASKGRLKDLILDENASLIASLQAYETDGDRRQLYSSFVKLAQC